MKNFVVILSVIFLANSVQAGENEKGLSCQAQERLSTISDENLIQWTPYKLRYENAAGIEASLFNARYSKRVVLQYSNIGNCYVENDESVMNLAIESDGHYSILESETFNQEIQALIKAESKAKTEEEKASASAKLKEARQENVQKIQKIIDALRASLANCEC